MSVRTNRVKYDAQSGDLICLSVCQGLGHGINWLTNTYQMKGQGSRFSGS